MPCCFIKYPPNYSSPDKNSPSNPYLHFSMSRIQYKWTKKTAVPGIAIFLVVLFLSGGGHGSNKPLIMLFPFSMIPTLFPTRNELIFSLLAIAQFPVYGLLIDLAVAHAAQKITLLSIAIIHILMAVLILHFETA